MMIPTASERISWFL